jgi:hypothetical protein
MNLQVRRRSSRGLSVKAEMRSKSRIFQCNSKVSETTFDTNFNFVGVFSNAAAAIAPSTKLFAMMCNAFVLKIC